MTIIQGRKAKIIHTNSGQHVFFETPETKTRGEVLKEAIDVINGERQDQYGSPEDSFQIIAEYWTAYLKAEGFLEDGHILSSKNTAVMMALFKIARISGQKFTKDSYRDCAGYIGIGADLAENQERK